MDTLSEIFDPGPFYPLSIEEHRAVAEAAAKGKKVKAVTEIVYADRTLKLAEQLQALTGLEARVTILGHLQRGGTPSAADRILATRLGTAAAQLVHKGQYGYMVAARGESTEPVLLEDVAGRVKVVPVDHPLVASARLVGTNFGD